MASSKSCDQEGGLETQIITLRGKRVILDHNLAELYGVRTKRLNEQVNRNKERFPEDFMFSLSIQEVTNLRSQIATSSLNRHGGRRVPPMAFTEYGALMLASVLNSPIAVAASIEIVRAFVRLRVITAEHRDLMLRVDALEQRYDGQFKTVFDAIRQLMTPPEGSKKKIGFGR